MAAASRLETIPDEDEECDSDDDRSDTTIISLAGDADISNGLPKSISGTSLYELVDSPLSDEPGETQSETALSLESPTKTHSENGNLPNGMALNNNNTKELSQSGEQPTEMGAVQLVHQPTDNLQQATEQRDLEES